MKKKPRPAVLEAEDARHLLNVYGQHEGELLGDLWIRRCSELAALNLVVEDYLKQATAPNLVARGMSRDARRSDVGRLVVGFAVDERLHLSFSRGASSLPTMSELRKRAKELGVDISHMGLRRREIAALLDSHKGHIVPDEVGRAPVVDSVLEKLRGKSPMKGS